MTRIREGKCLSLFSGLDGPQYLVMAGTKCPCCLMMCSGVYREHTINPWCTAEITETKYLISDMKTVLSRMFSLALLSAVSVLSRHAHYSTIGHCKERQPRLPAQHQSIRGCSELDQSNITWLRHHHATAVGRTLLTPNHLILGLKS